MSSTQIRGTFAGRYELRELIRSGGMGDVHAAWDVQMNRPVAIKLLRADLAHVPGMRARVAIEARAAARLAHPNVVTVFDSGEHDGRPFIVMELLDGRTLADEIARGPFSTERARAMGLQVLAALGVAHAAGVIHRDVKPGNVLLAEDEVWKVGDFGIAKGTEAEITLTRTGELLGSPSYLAPERLTGSPASPASDLYSLGVVLYEAVAGRRPFEGTDAWSVALQIGEGRFPPVRSVRHDADPDLCAAIERAMAKTPNERFPTAAAMAAALRDRSSAIATVSFVMPVPAEATAIIPASPPDEPTLPAPPAVAVAPGAKPAAAERRHTGATRRILTAATAVVLAVGIVVALTLLIGATTEPAPSDAVRTDAPIPPELDRALDRLRDAVRP